MAFFNPDAYTFTLQREDLFDARGLNSVIKLEKIKQIGAVTFKELLHRDPEINLTTFALTDQTVINCGSETITRC